MPRHHHHHHHHHPTRNILIAGAAGAAVGAAVGSSAGGGRNDRYYDDNSYGGTTTYVDGNAGGVQVSSSYDESPSWQKYAKILAVSIICTLILCFFFFPYGYDMDWEMAPGESAIVRSEKGKRIDPTWHKAIKVSSSNSTKDSLYGYLYDTCPDKATDHRYRTVDSSFNTVYYAMDSFYLNPGSSVNVTWSTKENVYFDIYEGEKDFQDGKNAIYSSGSKMAMSGSLTNFNYFPYSDVYYFVYQAKTVVGAVIGSATYELDMTVYDNSSATWTCDIGDNKCTFNLRRGSKNCVVVDVPNLEGPDGTYYYFSLRVTGRWGFYFAMFLVVPVAFYVIVAGILYYAQLKKYQADSQFDQTYEADQTTAFAATPAPMSAPVFEKAPEPVSIQKDAINQGYPPQGYAPSQQGYPPPQGYPPAQGYPPPQQGYPPPQGNYQSSAPYQ
eukprot:CAMPEP_0201516580 /NCGR_PEP_ID=MMETSP0161_2-20130828/7876_1 /ASSEMBLY_ACC=CAM_ASM_000251 /TAXON_ID=180227 /ORGANISM="Neoparamoeba aestuarina, Strain SoJaBio B1-5/56/2" /LENGTH=440 /DNA_ID=CAMNT_0047913765 /DNA_START=742 /DNA_END=2064 /DNA_ORIENTATION=+